MTAATIAMTTIGLTLVLAGIVVWIRDLRR